MTNTIPIELKQRCVDAKQSGLNSREIYNTIFYPEHNTMSYETFKRKLRTWCKRQFADEKTLSAGTYCGFTAHGATVQVDADGKIRQAWIKQTTDDFDYTEILEAIKSDIKPAEVKPCEVADERMLEIPLFDMHFGVAKLSDYERTLSRICRIICDGSYEEINVVFGQDMLHNNDFRGHTAKGTPIERVDMRQAWTDAFSFWQTVLMECTKHSLKTNVIYSKGNHDECTAWCLLKALEQRFPQLTFDDTFRKRKAIYWKECFIGVDHGEETKNSPKDLRGNFTIEFPIEFSKAKVREIHTGHLHSENELGDKYGIMVRRLASKVPTDEWTYESGFVGSHKRFMLYEWTPGELRDIHYI